MDQDEEPIMSQQTPARVRMIFSVMASPNRIDILRILNSKRSLSYSELKAQAGFHFKKESGKFAYHLRKLLKQSLVASNKNEKMYSITNLGKLVLSLARQIEEKSIIESGRLHVRTSQGTIEEFNSDRITQSLVREGRMSMEMAEKVTEETEDRIYKHQITHLSGSTVRDIANIILLENSHDYYRNRMLRLGMPVHDLQRMLDDACRTGRGVESLMMEAGRRVLAEYTTSCVLDKNTVDMHLSGDIHISHTSTWKAVADTVFVDGGTIKYDTPSGLAAKLADMCREASVECVVYNLDNILEGAPAGEITEVLCITQMLRRNGARLSVHLPLSSDSSDSIMEAYGNYVNTAGNQGIGLIVEPRGGAGDAAERLAAIMERGGSISIAAQKGSAGGIALPEGANTAMALHSLAINLPRLAYESNRDEMYFRTKMSMAIGSAIPAILERSGSLADITRRGLNPAMAEALRRDDSVILLVNLVGLDEALAALGTDTEETRLKVLDTAARAAGKSTPPVGICTIEGSGSGRLVSLDLAKYGKKRLGDIASPYSQGRHIGMRRMAAPGRGGLGALVKSAGILGGNQLTRVLADADTSVPDITECIRIDGLPGYSIVRDGSS